MINLIPQTAKSSITREYWMRVVSVWFFTLSGAVMIIATLLIPVFALVNSQITAYSESAEAAISEVDKYTLSSTALVRTSQDAARLAGMRNEARLTDFVELFEELENEAVTIERIELTKKDGDLDPISISGLASTRQALADFREILLENERVEKVFLPISNLAEDKDIKFAITVTMKQD